MGSPLSINVAHKMGLLLKVSHFSALAFPATCLRAHHCMAYILAQVNHQQRRYAGHSHWANIKVTKQTKDTQKSIVYNQLVNQIKLAIRDSNGNTNPASNDRLAHALKMARLNSLPRATVDKVIKRWQQGDREASEPFVIPIQGPCGAFILVECIWDRPKEAQAKLNMLLKKVAMKTGELHSMMYAFDRKGIIKVLNSDPFVHEGDAGIAPFVSLDRAEEVAIEVGAEEVRPVVLEDGTTSATVDDVTKYVHGLEYTCGMGDFHKVKKGLIDTYDMPVKSAELEYVPNRLICLERNLDRNLVLKLWDQLHENFEALSKIYTNIDFESLQPTSNTTPAP